MSPEAGGVSRGGVGDCGAGMACRVGRRGSRLLGGRTGPEGLGNAPFPMWTGARARELVTHFSASGVASGGTELHADSCQVVKAIGVTALRGAKGIEGVCRPTSRHPASCLTSAEWTWRPGLHHGTSPQSLPPRPPGGLGQAPALQRGGPLSGATMPSDQAGTGNVTSGTAE